MNTQRTDQSREPRTFVVTGHVRFVDDIPAPRTEVAAFDRDLRRKKRLGEEKEKHFTDRTGAYRIEYTDRQFLNQERGAANQLLVR